MTTAPLPLAGVRVLDFTWIIAGPLCTKVLAAHGAEVIKIEPGGARSDAARRDTTLARPGAEGVNASVSFANLNANKLSVTLDMKRPESQEIARSLVAVSDVVIDNFTPDVLPAWGLDYDQLRAVNPQIIAVSMPGMGSTGPHRGFRGLGTFFQARSGLDELAGYPHREAMDIGFAYPDTSCNPFHTAVAVLAALHHRNRTGEGQRIEVSQFESTVAFIETALLDWTANGRRQPRPGARSPHGAPHGTYRCAGDDQWCTITVSTQEEWSAFRLAIGSPDWTSDARFATLDARKTHEDQLDALVTEWTSQRSPLDAMQALQRHGVAAGAVQSIEDLVDRDPQLAFRDFYPRLVHAEIGELPHEGIPFQLSETPGRLTRPAPLLGEHTDYVLQDLLGIPEQQVNQYILDGVITA